MSIFATILAAAAASDAEGAGMSQPDAIEDTSNWTAIVLAIVSLVFYWIFLKPTTDDVTEVPNTTNINSRRVRSTAQQQQQQAQQQALQPPRPPPVVADSRLPQNLSENALAILEECQSKPSFVITEKEKVGLGGQKALMDGLVAFGHTSASSITPSSRTERAKVLSRLGSSPGMTLTAPPSKGSTMVVSFPYITNETSMPKLCHILQVLGSYYNLIVIGSIDPSKSAPASLKEQQEQQETLQKLLYSDSSLTETILPSHRILLASSKVGRIALVRQLAKVKLVVDYQAEVQTELGRFGYSVAVVPELVKLLDD